MRFARSSSPFGVGSAGILFVYERIHAGLPFRMPHSAFRFSSESANGIERLAEGFVKLGELRSAGGESAAKLLALAGEEENAHLKFQAEQVVAENRLNGN